jgi:hypothetical protein
MKKYIRASKYKESLGAKASNANFILLFFGKTIGDKSIRYFNERRNIHFA